MNVFSALAAQHLALVTGGARMERKIISDLLSYYRRSGIYCSFEKHTNSFWQVGDRFPWCKAKGTYAFPYWRAIQHWQMSRYYELHSYLPKALESCCSHRQVEGISAISLLCLYFGLGSSRGRNCSHTRWFRFRICWRFHSGLCEGCYFEEQHDFKQIGRASEKENARREATWRSEELSGLFQYLFFTDNTLRLNTNARPKRLGPPVRLTLSNPSLPLSYSDLEWEKAINPRSTNKTIKPCQSLQSPSLWLISCGNSWQATEPTLTMLRESAMFLPSWCHRWHLNFLVPT